METKINTIFSVYAWNKEFHKVPKGRENRLSEHNCSGSYHGNDLNDPSLLKMLSGELMPEGCYYRIVKRASKGEYMVTKGETYKIPY